jgi:hypothetical protein
MTNVELALLTRRFPPPACGGSGCWNRPAISAAITPKSTHRSGVRGQVFAAGAPPDVTKAQADLATFEARCRARLVRYHMLNGEIDFIP